MDPPENDTRGLFQPAANSSGAPLEFLVLADDLEAVDNRIVLQARQEYEDYRDVDRYRARLARAATAAFESRRA